MNMANSLKTIYCLLVLEIKTSKKLIAVVIKFVRLYNRTSDLCYHYKTDKSRFVNFNEYYMFNAQYMLINIIILCIM